MDRESPFNGDLGSLVEVEEFVAETAADGVHPVEQLRPFHKMELADEVLLNENGAHFSLLGLIVLSDLSGMHSGEVDPIMQQLVSVEARCAFGLLFIGVMELLEPSVGLLNEHRYLVDRVGVVHRQFASLGGKLPLTISNVSIIGI